jgi:hypothetical protein
MPRNRHHDDDELELDDADEEGFVRLDDEDDDEDEEPKRPKRRQPAAPEPVSGEAAEVAQLRAEVSRMSGELARLRAAGGLEARRDEPATVGDVIDALQAEREAIRAELADLAGRHYPRVRDELAAHVESRLLDGIDGIADEDEWDDEDEDDEDEVAARRGKRKPNGEPAVVKAHQAYVDEDGQMRVARRTMELPPGARLLD